VSDRVVVFVDYQNVYRGARRAFHIESDSHWLGQVDPLRLGQHLANDSPFDRALAQVRVYRGQPDAAHDARGYSACRRQVASWSSPLVEVTLRTLRYPAGWPNRSLPGEKPQEKGIDVALAMDLVLMATAREYDVAILMSTDTDLKPALEYVASLTNKFGSPRVEVAAWSAKGQQNRRLAVKTRMLYCHWVDHSAYATLTDPTDYTP
jgi:hypothetical protein